MQQITKNEIYKHYIALDWSQVNFALASIRDSGTRFEVVEHPPDLKILKDYFVPAVDDDIEKGIRYFYRVQAFNSNGSGPVSEAVSRIQQ